MNWDVASLQTMALALRTRTSNMPEDMRQETIGTALEERWNTLYARVAGYLAGPDLIRHEPIVQAFFNVVSLGDWITIAQSIGQNIVPARLIGVFDPVLAFQCATDGLAQVISDPKTTDAHRNSLFALINEVNAMKRTEILRFDPCCSARLKLTIQDEGQPDADCRGLADNGKFLEPIFEDPRLADQFLWYTGAAMPVWARPWVRAMRIKAATSPYMKLPSCGTRAVEWRLYVHDGEIVAASQYYPHAPIMREEALDRYGLQNALAAGNAMLGALDRLSLVPHHPRYEMREDVDPSKVHCTLDYLVTPEGAPLLLEAGPAHLRNPNFGAHPCNFGVKDPPRGIATSLDARTSI